MGQERRVSKNKNYIKGMALLHLAYGQSNPSLKQAYEDSIPI